MQNIRWFLTSPFEVERIQRIEADAGSGLASHKIPYIPADGDRYCLSPVVGNPKTKNSNGGVDGQNKGSKDYRRQMLQLSLSTLTFIRYSVSCRNVNQRANLTIPSNKLSSAGP